MSDLRELYQEVIIDHSQHPRNCRVLQDASHHAEGYNPLCGDQLSLYLEVSDGQIRQASFTGSGCAISTASASLMTEMLRGKTLAEAESLFNAFHLLMTSPTMPELSTAMGKLTVLAGVREFPSRIKCATLAWHTLQAALHHQQQPASTE